jgi:predicted oxidoreductase
LQVDDHGRVLHVRGTAIPGLYASGNVASYRESGIGYQAGITLTRALTYSYLAVKDMLSMRTP